MASARIAYRNQAFLFPAVDDPEMVGRQRQVDRRLAFSSSGKQESSFTNAFDIVRVSIADVVTDSFIDEIEAWWSHARQGSPYTFSFDDTDTVLTALDVDAAAGTSLLDVSLVDGIVAGNKYLLMQDLLGRNNSRNLLPSAQSKVEATGDFVFGGTGGGATVTPAKEGAVAIKLTSAAIGDDMSFASAILSPSEGFVTFSIWYRDQSTPSAFTLKLTDGTTTGSKTIVSTSAGVFRRAEVTVFFPAGAAAMTPSVESLLAGAQDIVVDAWQIEVTQHPTPWRDGLFTSIEATLSTQGLAEVVKVLSISGNQLTLTTPLKFDYKRHDALKSFRHWERVVSLDNPSPLRDKLLTRTFRHRFREVQ